MKRHYFLPAVSVMAWAALSSGCKHETDFDNSVSTEDVLANAEMRLGIEIDPNQDWVMTETMTADITVALGLDQEYTVAIYNANPLYDSNCIYYTRTKMAEGESRELTFTVPKGLETVYVAAFDSKLRRVVSAATVNEGKISLQLGSGSTAKAPATRATEAEWTGTDPAYAHTMMDYLSFTQWTMDYGWGNTGVLYGKAVTIDEMKAYPELTDDLIVNWTSNGNHTLSDQSWKYSPAQFPGGGDGKHFYVKPGTEITEVFHINGAYGTYNDAIIYIEGTVHLNGNTLNGPTLAVGPGGKIIVDGNTYFSNAGRFVVMAGGTIESTNGAAFSANNGAPCYNAGTINMPTSVLNVNGSDFYNCGTVTVGQLEDTSYGGRITNFGSITANNNSSAANTYNCEVINACHMTFTGDAGVGQLKMLNNSRLDVGGKLQTSGTVKLYTLSEIHCTDLQVQMTAFEAPTATGEFAVLKIDRDIYAGQGGDFESSGNLYADWGNADKGLYANNTWTDLFNQWSVYGIIYGKLSLISEPTSPVSIPAGECTGTGYNDNGGDDDDDDDDDDDIPGSHPIYSYAFEDSEIGDYDMNDVVLQVQESADEQSIVVTLVACGGTLDCEILIDDVSQGEVHDIIGANRGQMVNTGAGPEKASAVVATLLNGNGQYRPDDLNISIKATGQPKISRSRIGGAPYGVVIPTNANGVVWRWPRERVCIKDAYNGTEAQAAQATFTDFVRDGNNEAAQHWYDYAPVEGSVY